MRVLHLATLVLGVLATATAIGLIHYGDAKVVRTWWKFESILGGGMLGLFFLGLLSRAGSFAAATGVTIGSLVILWIAFSHLLTGDWQWLSSPFHHFMGISIGTLTVFMVGVLLLPRSRGAIEKGTGTG